MKRLVIFLILIIITASCTIKNSVKLNSIQTITSLPKGVEREQTVKVRKIYKLKSGLIAVKYKKYYGYWHRIRRGESLYKIARRNGYSVKYLRRANNRS